MKDFNDCINQIEIDDLRSSGFHFTWTKSLRNPHCTTLKNLDRIMCNDEFGASYPQAFGMFLPYLISDHSPSILNIPNSLVKKKRAFRFMNHLAHKDDFLDIVKQRWSGQVVGYKMFQVVSKLKLLKKDLIMLNWRNGNAIQALLEYENAKKDESILLQQKVKIKWLAEGDRNTRFFHNMLKKRKMKNKIDSICDDDGVNYEGDQVATQFVNHFMIFLGDHGRCRSIKDLGDIFFQQAH
ncbi:uncharacterized protein [Rutidosis leptorrhynchoides]|uniref:uncharacterized protein n=1 Tax=Rutidosis leptorrhynchoides TaxID=125765 RepID=UPI003A9A121E